MSGSFEVGPFAVHFVVRKSFFFLFVFVFALVGFAVLSVTFSRKQPQQVRTSAEALESCPGKRSFGLVV